VADYYTYHEHTATGRDRVKGNPAHAFTSSPLQTRNATIGVHQKGLDVEVRISSLNQRSQWKKHIRSIKNARYVVRTARLVRMGLSSAVKRAKCVSCLCSIFSEAGSTVLLHNTASEVKRTSPRLHTYRLEEGIQHSQHSEEAEMLV